MKINKKFKSVILTGALILMILLAGTLFYGLAIEPYWLETRTENARIPDLPAKWEGRQIAVIADLQVGMWWHNTDTVKEAVARIIEAKPAAVLLAGDFVYAPKSNVERELEIVKELLRPLTDEARLPVYAVLGNHDYNLENGKAGTAKEARRSEEVRATLESIGIKVLHNESVQLKLADSQAATPVTETVFHLVGIGPHQPAEDDPQKALASVPDSAARIILIHNPKTFKKLPPRTAPLTIAGHTHGGQIRIPLLPHWSWLNVARDLPADGWIEDYGNAGNRLYINRGIGFSNVPVRVNCRPELTFFVLKPAN